VEVKIGVQFANRELVIETNMSTDEIEKVITDTVAGDATVLALSDTKGRRVIVPTDKLAYVELGTPTAGQVGFRS
jgi:hypothetical protein